MSRAVSLNWWGATQSFLMAHGVRGHHVDRLEGTPVHLSALLADYKTMPITVEDGYSYHSIVAALLYFHSIPSS